MAKMADEEHHEILFELGADKFKYRKLIEDMKNDIIRKKYPFPKTDTEACQVISKWQNTYNKYNNGKSDSNDGIAFTTMTEEKVTNKNEKRRDHLF